MTTERQRLNEPIIAEFRANEGRVGGPFEGAPLLLLHTTGARSGEERVNPLVHLDLDGHVYVFASSGGRPHHPAWFHNLLANPDVRVERGTTTYDAKAVPLDRAERDRIYAEQVRRMPGFGDYERSAAPRIIPVVELVPV
jgi:deazaflavin-dependent oxidoreductase (nitroreductase family)